MIPADAESPADERVRLFGQYDNPGDSVRRGFPRVLCDQASPIGGSESGRIALAQWLTDESGRAGQLAARVLANRVWRHAIGRGIVATPDNFGRTGEAPTHLELLDYLARELIDSNWSIKDLLRQVVLSRTFAMASDHLEANHERDPENRLLWRAHRRRLDPESLRDAMLFAAGRLDLRPMDSTVWYLGDQATAVGENKVRRRTDFPCRSVYLPVIRNDLPELFEVFDFANPHETTGDRTRTIVPTQGLYVLNDPMVMDAAEAAARSIIARAGDPAERVNLMFESILGAEPADGERQMLLEYLQGTEEQLRSSGEQEAELRAWTLVCHALFASSRFQYLE
jgi:hypothetical protein